MNAIYQWLGFFLSTAYHILDTRRRPAVMTWSFYSVNDTSSTPRRMVIIPRVGHQALVCENRAQCVNLSFVCRLYCASCLLNPDTDCHIYILFFISTGKLKILTCNNGWKKVHKICHNMRHIRDVRYRHENFTTILYKEIVLSTKYLLVGYVYIYLYIVEFFCLFLIMCVYIHHVVESQVSI